MVRLQKCRQPVYAERMGDSVDDRYTRLIDQARREFPGFRIVRKHDSALHRLIHRALAVITLGGMRDYLKSYQTTIGSTVYVTSDWDERDPDERYITMRHELVHIRQFRRYSLVGMALLYVLLPLPLGIAYFRARFEREAYEETLRAACEVHGLDHVRASTYRDRIIAQFVGPAYGWMWPFRRQLDAWYDRMLMTLEAELPAPSAQDSEESDDDELNRIGGDV